jgi:hypothetical protein
VRLRQLIFYKRMKKREAHHGMRLSLSFVNLPRDVRPEDEAAPKFSICRVQSAPLVEIFG